MDGEMVCCSGQPKFDSGLDLYELQVPSGRAFDQIAAVLQKL